MEKSIYTREYDVVVQLLQEFRTESGVTQVELAAKLGQSQSFVSKCERGERRLDIVQLRTICRATGTSLPAFVDELEKRLRRKRK